MLLKRPKSYPQSPNVYIEPVHCNCDYMNECIFDSIHSSTIKIEGFAGNDPQTIAKKHLLLNNLRGPESG